MMLRESHNHQYLRSSEIIEQGKQTCGLAKPNTNMTDGEIKDVMRSVAREIPGSIALDEEFSTSRFGIEMMLFLTLMEFPDYYERFGLSQFN